MGEISDTTNPLDGLEERLKSHSKAFESLLALTPAQEYYGTAIVDGRDPSEQWRAKKQSKAEKRAARKAKLDPANQKSALDVMKEREKKRKRELGMNSDDEDEGDVEAEAETDAAPEPTNKRTKTEHNSQIDEVKRKEKAEKRKEKREKKKEKQEKQKVKQEAKRTKKHTGTKKDSVGGASDGEAEDVAMDEADLDEVDVDGLAESDEEEEPINLGEVEDGGSDGGANDQEDNNSVAASSVSSSSSFGDKSPAFDISAGHSTTSSSSSILPPTIPDSANPTTSIPQASSGKQTAAGPNLKLTLPKPPSAASILKAAESDSRTSSPKPQFPKVDQAILQERLRVRIEELRAKRKADGAEGQPARSRQELLEQRRKKADQRKVHKKELRRQAREEEARKQEEQLRGSGSPLSGADIFSPRSESNSFSFSRLAFGDGTMADASLTKLVDAPKHKGPQDVKTALLAAENKQKRLSALDEQKRADIGEKDVWLNASKRAHGERVRDDQSLLKKALKRKEKQKSKSESAWQEREQAVVKGKEMKQKKRDDNLAKRRDEKGSGSSSKKKPAKKSAKKSRPGFEGRFRA